MTIQYNKKTLGSLLVLVVVAGLQGRAQMEKSVAAYAKSFEREKLRDYEGAIKCIAGLNDSTSYENNLRLGWLCYKAGHEKSALSYYQKAINLKPGAIEPRLGFSYPAYLLEDMGLLIAEDKKILQIDPENKVVNSNLALIYFYNKDYAKALPLFQKVVEHYPFDYDNNLWLAWTYLHLGKNEESEKHFNIVLMYSPTDASAKEGLENLGKTPPLQSPLLAAFSKSYELAAASDYKASAKALLTVYDKSSYYLNLRLGWLSHLAGLETDAAAYYKLAMALMPGSVEARLGACIPAEAMGNKAELKAIYEAILAIDPQNTSINYKLGGLYYEKKDFITASGFLEKVVNLYPFDYDGLLLYAWIKYYAGQHEEARALFYKVLCISPADASATRALSLKPVEIQEGQGRKEEIIRPK